MGTLWRGCYTNGQGLGTPSRAARVIGGPANVPVSMAGGRVALDLGGVQPPDSRALVIVVSLERPRSRGGTVNTPTRRMEWRALLCWRAPAESCGSDSAALSRYSLPGRVSLEPPDLHANRRGRSIDGVQILGHA